MKLLSYRTLLTKCHRLFTNSDKPSLFSSVISKSQPPKPKSLKFNKPQKNAKILQPSLSFEMATKLREAVKTNNILELTEELRKKCISDTDSYIAILETILRFNTYYTEFSTKFFHDVITANQDKLNFEDSCLVFYFLYRFNLLKRFEDFKKHLNTIKPDTMTSLHNKYVQFYCLMSRIDIYTDIISNFEMANLDIDIEIINKLVYKLSATNAGPFVAKIIAYGERRLSTLDTRSCLNYIDIYANTLNNVIERHPDITNDIRITAEVHNTKISQKIDDLVTLGTNFELSKILTLVHKYNDVLKVMPSTVNKLKDIDVQGLVQGSQDKSADFWMMLNYMMFLLGHEGLSDNVLKTEKLISNAIKENEGLYLNNDEFRTIVRYLSTKLDHLDSYKLDKDAVYQFETDILPLIGTALNKSVGKRSSSLNLTAKMFYTFRSWASRSNDPIAKTEYLKNVKRLEFLVAFHAKAWIYAENKQKQFFEDYKEFCNKKKIGSKKCLALVQMALDNLPINIRAQQYEKFEELKTAKIDLEKKKQGKSNRGKK